MEGLLDELGDHGLRDRCLARWSGLVAQQAVDPVGHETLLPAPHARLTLARSPHDLVGPQTVGGQQHDLRPPDMFLGTVPIANDRFQPLTITRIEPDLDTASHPRKLARHSAKGNLLFRLNH